MRKEVYNCHGLVAASQGCIVTAASIRGRDRGSVDFPGRSLKAHGRGPAAVLLRPTRVCRGWGEGYVDKSENKTACHSRQYLWPWPREQDNAPTMRP